MSTTLISAEFTLPEEYSANRSGPKRWLLSHTLRYWPLGIVLIVGAISNAALAAVVPILVGQAFDLVLGSSGDVNSLLGIALIIAGTQIAAILRIMPTENLYLAGVFTLLTISGYAFYSLITFTGNDETGE